MYFEVLGWGNGVEDALVPDCCGDKGAELSAYQFIFQYSLMELWLVIERKCGYKWWKLVSSAGCPLGDRVKSSDICAWRGATLNKAVEVAWACSQDATWKHLAMEVFQA